MNNFEELLKVVANYCENNISDTSEWHSLLLKRMMQPLQGVCPALLSIESYDLLNALRGFWHFFRHAYGVPLDFLQLQSNLHKAVEVKPGQTHLKSVIHAQQGFQILVTKINNT